jgi:cytochrome c
MQVRGWSRARRTAMVVGALMVAAVGTGAGPAAAQTLSPAEQRGLTFVRVHCAQCHSIDVASESPLKIAPPFRDLHLRFPVDTLTRRLSEGITANHPTMPQFRLDADQTNDVVAFIKSLQR